MAISVITTQVGTAQANQTGTYNQAFTLNSSTKALIVAVTNFDTADGLSGAAFDTDAMTLAHSTYDATTDGWLYIYYLNDPQVGSSKNLYLQHAGTTITDLMFCLIEIDTKVVIDNTNTAATGNGAPASNVTTIDSDTVVVGAAFSDQATGTKLTALAGTSIYIEDLGSDTGLVSYRVETSSGVKSISWEDVDNDEDWVEIIASFAASAELSVPASSHGHSSTNPTLVYNSTLVPQNGSHTHVSTNLALPQGIVCHIDFEDGDTSEFDSVTGTVTVSTGNALVGTYGASVTHAGDGADHHGNLAFHIGTNECRFRVYYEDVSMAMTAGDNAELVSISADGSVGGNTEIARLIYQNASGEERLNFWIEIDDGTTMATGSVARPAGPAYVECVLYRASSAVASDGSAQMWINGSSVGTVTGIDNYDTFPTNDGLRLGGDSGDPGTTGTIRFDDFILRDDDTEIGPAPSGDSLTVQPGAHTHTSTSPALTQAHTLAPQNGSHTHTSENPDFTYNVTLVSQDGSHTHVSASPTLIQDHQIAVQAGAHTHISESPSLSMGMTFPWNDGFETGDTTEWDGSSGTVTINGTAAIVGSYGIELDTSNVEYVYRQWENTTHQVYRVKFYINTNNLTASGADQARIVLFYDDVQLAGGVEFGWDVDHFAVRTFMRNDSGVPQSSAWNAISSGTDTVVEAEFTFADTSGASKIWIDDTPGSGQSGIDTGTRFPDEVRFGQGAIASAFDSGTYHLDEFYIYDTVRPSALSVQDGSHTHSSANPILVRNITLVPSDGSHTHASENPVLSAPTGLSVQDGSHTNISENPVLVYHSSLVSQDGSHGHSSENPSLGQLTSLVPSDGSHTHQSENPAVTQLHDLAVQDSSHTHASENPILVRNIDLVPQDSTHAHTSDSPALTQQQTLDVQDGQHTHASSSPSLSQDHILVTQDGSHTHVSQNPNLSGASTLSIQNGLHTHISSNPLLVQYHNLVSQDGSHTHVSENVDLSVTQYLAAIDGSHTNISDTFAITQTHNLVSQDGLHSHVASAPTISVTHHIEMQDGSHTHISENVDLTQIEWFSPRIVAPRRSMQIPIRQLRL